MYDDVETEAGVQTTRDEPGKTPWAIKGELILNCNCTVFCPCVVSLGKHAPTEGYCQAWAGVRIDEGFYGDADISGLNVGLLLEIPGLMARGNWKAAAFIDERADDGAYDGLVNIFSGAARGTTGLFSLLVSEFLGAERAPVIFETEGKARRLMVGKKIQGEVVPVGGSDPDSDIVVTNTQYWMGPDITVATATKGRVRAFGRVWDFDGRSAEICQIDWVGPQGR
ncbi:protein involved in DMSP breakdown [Roseibacterium elongatum DSM 19469]|uniref:Protein involved in DMSP breakdown n=1 Tax=Roseicyclus elongatus DSM 19469 TaxID=1294273 RepID=W8SRA9_9RHOB|nr:DUF1326 domain-containing protein [Roseibacterium elongatum]AHM05060.1 protein involved in DMSP breakdown [Roseibacterium elongatum DSM 19469]